MTLFNGRDLSGFDTWLVDHHDRDPDRVFSVVEQVDGAPAIRISGQHWGGIATRERYADYRLVVEFRWGLLTWGARQRAARDSGVLVHGEGPLGNTARDMNGPWLRSNRGSGHRRGHRRHHPRRRLRRVGRVDHPHAHRPLGTGSRWRAGVRARRSAEDVHDGPDQRVREGHGLGRHARLPRSPRRRESRRPVDAARGHMPWAHARGPREWRAGERRPRRESLIGAHHAAVGRARRSFFAASSCCRCDNAVHDPARTPGKLPDRQPCLAPSHQARAGVLRLGLGDVAQVRPRRRPPVRCSICCASITPGPPSASS